MPWNDDMGEEPPSPPEDARAAEERWEPRALLAFALIVAAVMLKPSGLAALIWVAGVLLLALPMSLLIALWSRDEQQGESGRDDGSVFPQGGTHEPIQRFPEPPRPIRPRSFPPSSSER